ncbi:MULTISPECIES: ABC transporter ATP-binding protein [unclassified Oceanispirochaeta]|uniref:ABC transporter ATP-binding protein n=1 Tax=unclassified Oceanispirochaeta TaxID=2635722 RepID=UPI000E08F1DD|nr:MULTISPECIES: ABC transporter ATP-binding protein [unclassified Oceanispirochaeta]MBF9017700.1 ABC transporter ATP-binding protein [Oceanispirochaeta sp. M2]NPD72103.1 ABC transporter ATP-binding protein [Oceanispirochaeta sp. M1]RDG32545.1 ABC transporter ATP-binding protein [Oceanispirochaeta sp. M1]
MKQGKQEIKQIPGGGHRGPSSHFQKVIEKPKDTKQTILRLWAYLKAFKFQLTLTLGLVLISTILNIINPYLMKIALDDYIISSYNRPALLHLVMIMIAIYLIASVISLFQQWMMVTVTQKAIRNLRADVFRQFQNLPVRFFDSRSSGDLMSRISNDIENISNTISSSFIELFSGVLSIAAVTVIMISINWQLALICLSILPLVMLLTRKLAKHTRKGFREQQKHLGTLNGIIEESISGQRVVQAFVKENEYINNFSDINVKLQKASRNANISAGFMGPIMNMMNNLNYAVTAFSGGVLATFGLVSIGTIAAFLTYTKQFSRPLNQMAQLYNTIQSAIAGAERVFEILDEKSEIEEAVDAQPLADKEGIIHGRVEIKDLHFRYKKDIPILKGISINANAGQTIAIVGPTGAGKTTIVNLLTRFYDYQSGSIKIDGKEIRTLKKDELRKSLGIVLQDTFLFSGTIKENIRYGKLEADDDEIMNAAKLANAHQFIHRMPLGYNSEVFEGGSKLSEGQKQLLAIARAILSDPAILILDEATSSVDTRTEIHIQEAMLKLMEGRTSFVIAHRLSTIKNADLILVMKEGMIVEQGTHHQLIENKGDYFEMHNNRFSSELQGAK